MSRRAVLWVENLLRGTPLNPSTSFRLATLLVLSVTAAFASASCESPSVGDMCSPACSGSTVCETVCPCGNASCQGYACVSPAEGGAYVFEDGGPAQSCSQP
jgi:hypothetical protein